MKAWLPIMTKSNRRVLFIDAFAGPGEYQDGEYGSPVIALRALIEHSAKSQMTGKINYLFIEKATDRCENLGKVLSRLDNELPGNCAYRTVNSSFDDALTKVLDAIDEQNKRLAPAFVMIDPFGVSDTPMQTIARILSNPKSEVYISFMRRDINRFKTHPSFESHLDNLFGTPEWRQCEDISGLYKKQLKSAGAKYVLTFELYKGNNLIYTIFFGTQSLDGCDKMKQAIWEVMPAGNYKFRGGQDKQLSFDPDITDFTHLENSLCEEFGYGEWIKIEDVEDFVKSDKTNFHSGHLKTKTLKPMEDEGKLEVCPETRNRKGTYPKGTILRFVEVEKVERVVQGHLL